MSNPRIKLSAAQEINLLSQVSRVCPCCEDLLFYKKGAKSYKAYEIAHIYPLNPTQIEETLLAGELRLSQDVNDEDNLITLCVKCHTKFDKPRTVEEYRRIFDIKKKLLAQETQLQLSGKYPLLEDIQRVILSLSNTPSQILPALDFLPKEVEKKLVGVIGNLTKQKILFYVREYFLFVKQEMTAMDAANPTSADVVAGQIKLYYLEQKLLGLSQQEIYKNIVAWLHSKNPGSTIEASEIITAFFIQNCEVF